MTEATVLVTVANHRSVPTAVSGATPKNSNSSGVISEPPPTPVIPTIKPVSAPANATKGSKVMRPRQEVRVDLAPPVLLSEPRSRRTVPCRSVVALPEDGPASPATHSDTRAAALDWRHVVPAAPQGLEGHGRAMPALSGDHAGLHPADPGDPDRPDHAEVGALARVARPPCRSPRARRQGRQCSPHKRDN